MPDPGACNLPPLDGPVIFQGVNSTPPPSGEPVSTVLTTAPGFSAQIINTSLVRITLYNNYNSARTGFQAQIGTNGVDFPLSWTVGSNTASFVAGGLTPGSQIYVRLRAFEPNGYSPFGTTLIKKMPVDLATFPFTKAITKISTGDEASHRVETALFGKFYVAGSVLEGGVTHATLLRYNADLSLDGCFGNRGLVLVNHVNGSEYGVNVKQLIDGRILFVESATENGRGIVIVARYQYDGTLDTSFGNNGVLKLNHASGTTYGVEVRPTVDGKWIVGAYLISSPIKPTFWRLHGNGTLDTTYGQLGNLLPTMPLSYDSYLRSFDVGPQGEIFMGNDTYSSFGAGSPRATVYKLTPSGAFDYFFGASGSLNTPNGGNISSQGQVRRQADGQVVSVSMAPVGSPSRYQGQVMRFSAFGQTDMGFGSSGITILGPPQFPNELRMRNLAIAPDGAIIVGGDANSIPTIASYFETQYVHAIAKLRPDGSLDNNFGQNGLAFFSPRGTLVQMPSSLLVADNGDYLMSGYALDPSSYEKDHTLIRVSPSAVRAPAPGAPGVATAQVSVGTGFHCYLERSGEVLCSGLNDFGQLGSGTIGHSSLGSKRVVGVEGSGALSQVVRISSAEQHSCAVDALGAVYCWGRNNSMGLLGNASQLDSGTPVRVKGVGGVGYLADIVEVSTASFHTCAVSAIGAVYCWGENGSGYGALGNGSTVSSGIPVQVKGVGGVGFLTNVVQVDNGNWFTCALTGAGEVYCWGANNYGQAGRGTTFGTTNTPAQVLAPSGTSGTLSGIRAIAAGSENNCALTYGGTVYCWGMGSQGQLGNGIRANSSVPIPAKEVGGSGDLTGIKAFSGGSYNQCALKETGQVICWGTNGSGQLGNGTQVSSTPPTYVKGVGNVGLLENVASLSAGVWGACAVHVDKSVSCWGGGSDGAFSVGASLQVLTPIKVQSPYGYGQLGL